MEGRQVEEYPHCLLLPRALSGELYQPIASPEVERCASPLGPLTVGAPDERIIRNSKNRAKFPTRCRAPPGAPPIERPYGNCTEICDTTARCWSEEQETRDTPRRRPVHTHRRGSEEWLGNVGQEFRACSALTLTVQPLSVTWVRISLGTPINQALTKSRCLRKTGRVSFG
jgi:hypothetical protein